MGRAVYAEEKLLSDISKLCKINGYIAGLILGQNSGQKDYVIHFARTPLTVEKEHFGDGEDDSTEKRKSVEKLSDIKTIWLADHAKQVTRMLPGGMWVLGIFIVGPGDIFAEASNHSKLNTILYAIEKDLASNPYLCGNGPCTEKLIFYLSSSTKKYLCKSLDISSAGGSYRPVEWKFQGNNKWHQIECQYDFEQFSVYQVTHEKATFPLNKQLKEIVHNISELVQKAICTIDGEIREESSSLEIPDKDKKTNASGEKSKEKKVFQANLYIPCEAEVPADGEQLKVINLVGEMKCTGILSSIVFLNHKAQVQEAVKAIKEDIIRSWASRIEMHGDSFVEEEVRIPEEVMVVHEPPRRVLIPLPHSVVALSDYLYPGEGPSEALIAIQELLDVKVNESLVQKDFEGLPDIQNLTSNSEPSKSDLNATSSSSGNSSFIFTGIMLAFIVLTLSFALRIFLNSHSD